jgi:hypothetical protein
MSEQQINIRNVSKASSPPQAMTSINHRNDNSLIRQHYSAEHSPEPFIIKTKKSGRKKTAHGNLFIQNQLDTSSSLPKFLQEDQIIKQNRPNISFQMRVKRNT